MMVRGTALTSLSGAKKNNQIKDDYDFVAIGPRRMIMHVDADPTTVGLECVDWEIAADGSITRTVYKSCSPLSGMVRTEVILAKAPSGTPSSDIDAFTFYWKDINCVQQGPDRLSADARSQNLGSATVSNMNRVNAVVVNLHSNSWSGSTRGTMEDTFTIGVRNRLSPLYSGAMGRNGNNCLA
jgi:hypothetical protein